MRQLGTAAFEISHARGKSGEKPQVRRVSLRRHRDAPLSGKPLSMMTAMQAFGWCHQYSIADLLIARDMGCELFTPGLDASRFAPVVRFRQSFHLGIQMHIQPHYGTAVYFPRNAGPSNGVKNQYTGQCSSAMASKPIESAIVLLFIRNWSYSAVRPRV